MDRKRPAHAHRIVLVERLAVNDHLAILQVDRLAGRGNNTLDKNIMLGGAIGVVKHHDIALLDGLTELEAHLLCQDLVANLDRGLHGAGGHHKGLDHKRANQEGGDQCDRDDRNPLKSAPQRGMLRWNHSHSSLCEYEASKISCAYARSWGVRRAVSIRSGRQRQVRSMAFLRRQASTLA